jgi:hypothetical protein
MSVGSLMGRSCLADQLPVCVLSLAKCESPAFAGCWSTASITNAASLLQLPAEIEKWMGSVRLSDLEPRSSSDGFWMAAVGGTCRRDRHYPCGTKSEEVP